MNDQEFTPEMAEGIYTTVYCPRGRSDCESLSQIISMGHSSFICAGSNNGENRQLERDEFRVCFKNSAIDSMEDYDKKDLTQTSAVMMQALAVIEERDSVTGRSAYEENLEANQ